MFSPAGGASATSAIKVAEVTRPSAPGYNSRAWRRVRAAYIAEHPRCEAPGCAAPARIVHHVDHRRPARASRSRWDNLAGLCPHHHREITCHPGIAWAIALESGGASPVRDGR